jgi:guanosine-3',5'-bis(diphosphate) 3'-pyrophosphohydrolase
VNADLGLILHAASFAADRHREQRRKGGDLPYINHPLAVAQLLCSVGNVQDAVTLAAAVLHDTLEDTRTTADELAERFGPEVRDVVVELTEDLAPPRAERRARERERAVGLSPRARLVRLADKAHNLHSLIEHPPSGWSVTRQWEYVEWCVEMAAALAGTNPGLEHWFRETLDEARAAIRRREAERVVDTD